MYSQHWQHWADFLFVGLLYYLLLCFYNVKKMLKNLKIVLFTEFKEFELPINVTNIRIRIRYNLVKCREK